jgi:hypothetical protein
MLKTKVEASVNPVAQSMLDRSVLKYMRSFSIWLTSSPGTPEGRGRGSGTL